MTIEYYIISLFIDRFGPDWLTKFVEWRQMMEKKWRPAEFDSASHQRFFIKFLVGEG